MVVPENPRIRPRWKAPADIVTRSGHTTALGYPNNPSEKAAQEKLAKDGHVGVDDLVPGLALVLDFAENMNNIVQINREFISWVRRPLGINLVSMLTLTTASCC